MSDSPSYLGSFLRHGYRDPDVGLFEAAWDQLEAEYLNRIETAASSFEGWRDRFRAAAAETLRLVEEHPLEARFLAVDSITAGDFGRSRQRRLSAHLASLIDAAREEIPEPDQVPAVTAQWILAIFFDCIYRHLAGDAGGRLEDQLPELMFLAISPYFGTEAGRRELFDEA